MNSPQQPQEECGDYLPPIHSVSIEGEFDGKPFRMTFNIIVQRVVYNVAQCLNQVNLCEDDRR